MRIKWYQKTLKQSFNINQAKASTVTHQSKTQSNTINQIYNKKTINKTQSKTIIKDNQNSIKKQSTTTINQL